MVAAAAHEEFHSSHGDCDEAPNNTSYGRNARTLRHAVGIHGVLRRLLRR